MGGRVRTNKDGSQKSVDLFQDPKIFPFLYKDLIAGMPKKEAKYGGGGGGGGGV